MEKTDPMPGEQLIYSTQAEPYEALIAREDYQGNLLPALSEIFDFTHKNIVETGAGTGRLTELIFPLARCMAVLDYSRHMLVQAKKKLREKAITTLEPIVADHRFLPLQSGSWDCVIAGWSVCYLSEMRDGSGWCAVRKAIVEFERLLKPGGMIILIETEGTGHIRPSPPEHLMEYLEQLREEGFESRWIRTDYQFASVQEAENLVPFFFGVEMLEKLQCEREVILPECTGIWWKKV
jgi:ubiquinone/menaquinone biosynthesis C-methylase UbiE